MIQPVTGNVFIKRYDLMKCICLSLEIRGTQVNHTEAFVVELSTVNKLGIDLPLKVRDYIYGTK